MTEDKWKFVNHYPITNYKCGLKAGDLVRLKKDLIEVDYKNKPTGQVRSKGEIWTVIPGADDGRVDVRFMQGDGGRRTWDDDRTSIDEWFEVVSPKKTKRSPKKPLPRMTKGRR
jgi:hypothetical protein